jgi:hypothetical protein
MTALPARRGKAMMHGMTRLLLALPFVLFAAGCAVEGTDMPPLGLPETSAAVEETDTCGAARYAYLVGQPKSVVERTTFPDGTRIILPGTAVTMDFRAERLNVLIDGNAAVERVYCG